MQEHIKTDQNKLKDAGYSESVDKPNLFYKPLSNDGAIFADMRTDVAILVCGKGQYTGIAFYDPVRYTKFLGLLLTE